MERKNVCQPPEYTMDDVAEFFEKEKARALRLNEIEAIIDDDYDLDRLRELVEADRKIGDEVWVIERDEDGEATDFSGMVFITSVSGVAFVSPTLNGSNDVDYILQDQIEQTASGFIGDLAAYPMSDCYWSREAAESALKGEHHG